MSLLMGASLLALAKSIYLYINPLRCEMERCPWVKDEFKRRLKRGTDRPTKLYKVLLEYRPSQAIYPIPLFLDSLSIPLLTLGLRKIRFDYYLALFQ